MPRAIALFEKEGDALVNRIEFQHDDLEFFRELFNNPEDDPLLYDGYPIKEQENCKIFERFGVMVDIERYDCFVDYYE